MDTMQKHGMTIEEITRDGFNIFSTFDMFLEDEDTGGAMVRSFAEALKNLDIKVVQLFGLTTLAICFNIAFMIPLFKSQFSIGKSIKENSMCCRTLNDKKQNIFLGCVCFRAKTKETNLMVMTT